MLKSALLLGAGIAIGAGAIQGLHAATGPMVYTVYEAIIKDEAAYAAAVPEVDKYIKDNGGTRIAGGFNKARLAEGKTPHRPSDRSFNDTAWFEKNRPCLTSQRPLDLDSYVRLARYPGSALEQWDEGNGWRCHRRWSAAVAPRF
jgi:hypothetical protein